MPLTAFRSTKAEMCHAMLEVGFKRSSGVQATLPLAVINQQHENLGRRIGGSALHYGQASRWGSGREFQGDVHQLPLCVPARAAQVGAVLSMGVSVQVGEG